MFEVTEVFKPNDFKAQNTLNIPIGKDVVELTTLTDMIIFNGVKITVAKDGVSLKIEVASSEEKAAGITSSKTLNVGPPKTRPDDPAGSPSRKPKVIVLP